MKINVALLVSGFVVAGGITFGGQLGCSDDPTVPATDAGTASDTGTATDSGGGADTGPAGPATLNGCAAADYVDHTAASATRTITWGFNQTPKCMKIAAGQTVTFTGDFTQHPLAEKGGSTPNPFSSPKGSGGSRTVDFVAPGTYGYECAVHNTSMIGAIFVQ